MQLEWIYLVAFLLITVGQGFNFRAIQLYSSSTVISETTAYTFIYNRYLDNNFDETAWRTQQVESDATITITFPNDYTLTAPTCQSVTVDGSSVSGATCSHQDNTITIENAFNSSSSPSNLSINNVELVIGGVQNPSPAVFTGDFSGSIGTDIAVPSNNGIQLTSAQFDSCTITFSPSVVNSYSTMIITLDPKNTLNSSSSVEITLPQLRKWTYDIQDTSLLTSTIVSCTSESNVQSLVPCSGDLGAYTITASDLFTSNTETQFSFGVSNFLSPPTLQQADSLTLTSYSNGYQVDTCTVFVSDLTAKPFNSLTIAPKTTMTVNSVVGLKLTMELPELIDQDDEFQITFPDGVSFTFVNVTGTGTYSGGSVNGQLLTITHNTNVKRNFSQGSSYILNIHNFTAPPSTKVTDDIDVTITRNGYAKITGTATLQAEASGVSGSVEVGTTTVWENTTYTFSIILQDGLSSDGMIKIVFPATVNPDGTSTCALSGTNVTNSPVCTYTDVNRTMTITQMNASASQIGSQTLQLIIAHVVNPPTTATSNTFSLSTYYTQSTDTLVSQGTILGVTATQGTISSATTEVIPLSYVVLATTVTYTVNFVTTYPIPQNGFVSLTIPLDITLNINAISSACEVSTNDGAFSNSACAAIEEASNYMINFTAIASSQISLGTKVSLKIVQKFTNPSSTRVVSSFGIRTYGEDGDSIESISSGVSVQMTTPSTMLSASISRDNNTNSADSTYTITLYQKPSMESMSYLEITFPSELSLPSSPTCTDLDSNTLTCTEALNVLTIILPNSTIDSVSKFGVIVQDVVNPPSYKPLGQFYFITKDADQIYSYAELTYTQNLANNAPSKFTSNSWIFSGKAYQSTSYIQFTISPSSSLPAYMIVSLAPSFSVDTTLSCTSFVGFSPTCQASSHTVNVSGTLSLSPMNFTISSFTTPLSDPSDYTVVTSYDSEGYLMDQSSTDILWAPECNLPCKTCTSDKDNCLTCYTNTNITTDVYLYEDDNSCLEVCPDGTYEDDDADKCLSCSNICALCEGSSTNCTDCDSNSSYPYLNKTGNTGTCLGGCPLYYYPDTSQYPVLCVECVDPCSTCTEVDTCLSCVDGYFFLDSSGECETSCPASTYIANSDTNECQPCDSQCSQCQGTVDNCTKCSSTAALHNGTCVTECPPPLVIKTGACADCDDSCLTCDTTYNNCTSCDTSSSLKYLYGSTCLDSCPQFYYTDDLFGLCRECDLLGIGCRDCLSSSTCQECDDGYVLLESNSKCYDEIPAGYANISGVAKQCTDDCATCDTLTDNCTSCKTKILDGNDCVDECQPWQVPQNRVCVDCQSPCLTCSNIKDNCTSCIAGLDPEVFLNNFACIENCPDYTYPNYNTNQCDDCIDPCDLCEGPSICVSCVSGFYFFNSTCDDDCPLGYVGLNKICQLCDSPCKTCQLSRTRCLSCEDGYYFLPSTNTCYINCPTGLYPNTDSLECTGCTAPCDTCTNTSSTCLTCSSGFLHKNKCPDECPAGFYEFNSECEACREGCNTCDDGSSCIDCLADYFYFNGFCERECPSQAPVIDSNRRCQDCSDTSCVVCDQYDQCSACMYPKLLHFTLCVDQCPTNYVVNGTECQYSPDPTNNGTDNDTDVNQTLNQTLTSADVFPVPFTVGGSFLGIGCIMSKFQFQHTFLSGALYSIWGLVEVGSLGYGSYLYITKYSVTQTNTTSTTSYYQLAATTQPLGFSQQYLEAMIFFGAVMFMFLLNIIALFAQNCFLTTDIQFNKWLGATRNKTAYYTVSFFSFLMSHKFKNILFCKMFNFQVFKAQLDTPQNFRVFNIFTLFSFIPSVAILYAAIILLIQYVNSMETFVLDQLIIAYIDVIVVMLVGLILGICNTCKGDRFFEEEDQDGIILNKRIYQSDEIMQEVLSPMIEEDHEEGGSVMNRQVFETERKLKTARAFEDTITEGQTGTIQKMNISVQAAPILHDYSGIQFYEEGEISDLSMFNNKVDKSINVTQRKVEQMSMQCQENIFENKSISIQYEMQKEVKKHEVSVQHIDNIERQEVSIQNNIDQMEASVQHYVIMEDLSLQHVPIQTDQEIQIQKEEQQHSIQCVPFMNNVSIQYSVKPIYESRSMEYLPDDEDESIRESDQKSEQMPVDSQLKLKQELELDVEQKIKREQELKIQHLQEQRQRQKQKLIQNFHKKQEERQEKQEKKLENAQVNDIFNNQSSRPDGSSFGNSGFNIINFNQPSKQNEIKRSPSAKTEKQLIRMLDKNTQRQLEGEESLSFNVTDDLQGLQQRKNVVFHEEEKIVLDDEEQIEDEENDAEIHKAILRNVEEDEIPSMAEKSRSTNFPSYKDGLKRQTHSQFSNNLLLDSGQIDDSKMEEEQEIIKNPIPPPIKEKHPARNKREQVDQEERTNINNLFSRSRNLTSAELPSRKPPSKPPLHLVNFQEPTQKSQSQKIKLRAPPLPDRSLSYQSYEESQSVSQNNALLENKNVRFEVIDNDQLINYDSQDDQEVEEIQKELKNWKSESKLKPSQKMSKKNDQKAIQRQLLANQPMYDNTEKLYSREIKKNQNIKKRVQEFEAYLERPPETNKSRERYKRNTESSERKRISSIQKIYNRPASRRQIP